MVAPQPPVWTVLWPQSCSLVSRCNNCGLWKQEEAFEEKYRHHASLRPRVWANCVERRLCRGACGLLKDEVEFTKSEWDQAGWSMSKRGRCKDCSRRNQLNRICSSCNKRFSREGFPSQKQWHFNDTDRTCSACVNHYDQSPPLLNIVRY
jgi:hypothetical protein